MDTVEELKKLKNLLDNNVISEFEFNSLKGEILGTSNHPKSNSFEPKGNVIIRFPGEWIGIFDYTTGLYIGDELHSKNSTKHGFSHKIKLDGSELKFKTKVALMSTNFLLQNLDQNKNYDIELMMDGWGKYSKKYNIKEV